MSGESQSQTSDFIPSQTGGSSTENPTQKTSLGSESPLEEPLLQNQKAVSQYSKKSKVVKKRAKMDSASKKQRRLEGRIRKLAGRPHPLDKTGLFGAIFYSWVNPFLWVGNKTSFFQKMHADVPKRDSVVKNEEKLFQMYKKKGSIGKSITSLYLGNIIKNFLLMGLCQLCLCAMSVLMYLILIVASDKTMSIKEQTRYYIYYFSGLVFAQIFGALLKNYIYCDLSRLSVRLKNGVIFAIFKKLLNISVMNPSEHTEGNILNYINVDAQKLEDAITKLNLLMESFWLVVFGFTICYFLVSFNIIACFVVFFTLTYLSTCLYKVIYKYEVQFMIAKDKRTQLLKNVINNVKYIKTRCWENFYHAKLFVNRNIELSAMAKSNFVFVAIVTMGWFTPSLSYVSTFFSMCYFKAPLEIAKILAFVRIFASILKGVGNIPTVIQFFIELKVSLKRLNVYFDAAEINASYVERVANNKGGVFALELDLGNFYWNKMDEKFMKKRREKSRKRRVKIRKYGNTVDEGKMVMGNQSVRSVSVMKSTVSRFTGKTGTTNGTLQSKISLAPTLNESLMSIHGKEKVGFQLMDIDLLIRKGELVMIFGGIGSGKSSILYSILNEMNPKYVDPQPKLKIQGDLLFVGQKPWLLNMSIKDNIVLDKPFDEDLLDRAIRLSALDSDIDMFDEGVQRVLTDGASNLSGGQRTRVALARAIYQDPDIYLFDDPLSALDGNVGEYLMETTISKELKGKTRIIVTHALHFLKYADKILYCDDGRITFKGSYKMLKDEPFFKKMMQMKQEEEIEKAEEEKKQKKTEKKKKEEKPKNEVRKLEQGEVKENPLLRMFSKEDRNKGRLSCSVIHTFIKNTGGYPFFMLYFILSVAGAFGQFYGVFYLLRWAGSYDVNTRWNELKVLTSIICGYCTLAMIRYYSYLALGVRLSRKIHANMVFRVLHAPVEEFLELVPKGRILNRFTKDVHTIDKVLIKIAVLAIFKMIQFFVSFYFMAKSLNVGICAVLTFFFICSIMIQNRSMNLKREIIRLEAISKSPIVTWASQTVKGLAQIRSTFKQQWFVAKMIRLIEANLKNSVLIYGLDSWFQLRISLLNVFLVQIPAFVFIIVTNYNGHSIAIEQIAMFLILSTALTDDIIAVLQSLSEFEASLIAIERCEFFNNIPPEAQYKTVVQEEKKFMMLPSDVEPSSLCLPQEHKLIPKGHVVFENVTARYGEDSEPVLKNLTFEVQPGEKVGIVGRTGAGKSSLIKLFWLSLRPSSGRVVVDGTDISTIDLKELRNEVMIVSQESALFLGSLRENIDPTSTKERDPELIMALDKLGFKNKNIIDKGLDYKVDAGGANFSQGERQVICFSRTLINKRKLIVLDEATANIDITTEQCIQKAQETEFKESTMFIIAHRINTVMNCDKIMVLKFGELMEFDSPENLLKNEDSYFKQIYDKMVEQNDGM